MRASCVIVMCHCHVSCVIVMCHCHVFLSCVVVMPACAVCCRSPGMANKFVINSEDLLQKRPRFNSVVSRGTALGGFKSQS